MLQEIITQFQFIETCPAPECNLSSKDVEQFVEEMDSYVKLFEPAFGRREQWRWSGLYVQGLLGDTQRKTVERMALELGQNVRDMQHFVGQSPWQKEPAVMIHQGLVAQSLGEADGVVLIGHKRIPDHSYGKVVRFVKQAVATFDNLVQYPAVENKLLIIDGDQDVVLPTNDQFDPIMRLALKIIQSVLTRDARSQPTKVIYVE